MLTATVPLRICLAGGGTDLEAYWSKYGGHIGYACISKCITIRIFPENSPVQHPDEIVAKSIERWGGGHGFSVRITSDVLPGSGLGGSGALTVGLAAGLTAIRGERLSLLEIAKQAYDLERNVLSRPVGVQDHYDAAFGGCMEYGISRDGDVVNVRDIVGDCSEMQRWVSLFALGTTRSAESPLREQVGNIEDGTAIEKMHEIRQIGIESIDAIRTGDWFRLGDMWNEHWSRKSQTAKSISNSRIDTVLKASALAGAVGRRISGAGSGGYAVFVAPPHVLPSLRLEMAKMGLAYTPVTFGVPGVSVRWEPT